MQSHHSIRAASNEDGFTVVEFIIVLLLASILFGAASSIYLFANKWVIRWQSDISLENSAHLMLTALSKDLRRASDLVITSDSSWVLHSEAGKMTQYVLSDSLVLRNGIKLHREDQKVSAFLIHQDSLMLPATVDLKSDQHKMVDVSFQIIHASRKLNIQSSVMMRQPNAWPVYIPWPDSIITFLEGSS